MCRQSHLRRLVTHTTMHQLYVETDLSLAWLCNDRQTVRNDQRGRLVHVFRFRLVFRLTTGPFGSTLPFPSTQAALSNE